MSANPANKNVWLMVRREGDHVIVEIQLPGWNSTVEVGRELLDSPFSHEWNFSELYGLDVVRKPKAEAAVGKKFNPRFDLKQAHPGVEPRRFDPEQALQRGQEVAAKATSEDWKI